METDAIFERVQQINKDADEDDGVLRISLDSKAVVKIGNFSRGGKSRQVNKAYDHDFSSGESLTPFGVFLPQTAESHIWFATSKVTADFMIDRLQELWPKLKEKHQPHTLVINADNGPECSGRRSQWLKRLQQFSNEEHITIQLAYYPPYHSKYNPVERLWGILENHWRGELLTTIEKTLGLARSMTYNKIKSVIKLVRKTYHSAVSPDRKEKELIEKNIKRDSVLEKWFIKLTPQQ